MECCPATWLAGWLAVRLAPLCCGWVGAHLEVIFVSAVDPAAKSPLRPARPALSQRYGRCLWTGHVTSCCTDPVHSSSPGSLLAAPRRPVLLAAGDEAVTLKRTMQLALYVSTDNAVRCATLPFCSFTRRVVFRSVVIQWRSQGDWVTDPICSALPYGAALQGEGTGERTVLRCKREGIQGANLLRGLESFWRTWDPHCLQQAVVPDKGPEENKVKLAST